MKLIKNEILAGFVTFLALLPEALGFTLIAGVDPVYGIISCFFMSFSTSIINARPAMISGAAGATALVLAGLVKSHGVDYLIWATLLAGVIQVLLFKLNFKKLLVVITPAITFGFLNGLGILMFTSQLPNLNSVFLIFLALISVVLIFFLRKLPIPSPILVLIIMTLITFTLDIPRLGEQGEIAVNNISIALNFNMDFFDTLIIIFPTALSVALIGLLESVLTAKVIEDKIDNRGESRTNYNLISISQGLGNILNALFGGIAGCGMIGQSIMNVSSGGRNRLSTFFAGFFFLFCALFFSNILSFLPLFALSAIMLVISYETFSTESVLSFKTYKNLDKIVIVCVTAIVFYTHNLFYGVAAGVIITIISNKFIIKENNV